MPQSKLTITQLNTDKEVKDFQTNNNGGFRFPIGSTVIGACIEGVDCANDVTFPDSEGDTSEQVLSKIAVMLYGYELEFKQNDQGETTVKRKPAKKAKK